MRRLAARPLRIAPLGLALALASSCTPSLLSRINRCLQSNLGGPLSSCRGSFTAWAERDPAGASARFRAEFAARRARCEAGALGALPSEEYYACLELALLRLGSTRVGPGDSNLHGLTERLAPELVVLDVPGALRMINALCPEIDAARPACSVRRFHERGMLGERTPRWVSAELAALVLRRTLADPRTTDIHLRFAQTYFQRVEPGMAQAAVLEGLQRELQERLQAAGDEAIVRQVAALERWRVRVVPEHLRDFGLEVHRIGTHLEHATAPARARVEERLRAVARRHLDAHLEPLLAREQFDAALAVLRELTPSVLAPVVTEGRERIRSLALASHEGHARRHRAAGGLLAARLHARLAVAYGSQISLAQTDATLERLSRPRLVVRHEGEGCAWAAPADGAPAGGGPDAAQVTVRWTRCESAERRWTSTDAYTSSEFVRTYEDVSVPTTSSHEECSGGHLTQSSTIGGAPSRTVVEPRICRTVTSTSYRTERVAVTREVIHPGTRQTEHRALHTAAEAVLTVAGGATTVTVGFRPEAYALEEEQYTEPRPRSFSGATLEGQRARIASAWSAALSPGGAVHAELGRATARSLERQAATAADPDAAEELFAQALYADASSAPGARFYRTRYGVSADSLAEALRRR